MSYHAVRPYDRFTPDRYSFQDNGVLADPAIVIDKYRSRDEPAVPGYRQTTRFYDVVGVSDQDIGSNKHIPSNTDRLRSITLKAVEDYTPVTDNNLRYFPLVRTKVSQNKLVGDGHARSNRNGFWIINLQTASQDGPAAQAMKPPCPDETCTHYMPGTDGVSVNH